jgi:hypothetical protein
MRSRDTDREWRLVTVPYWRATPSLRDGVLLGEVPLRTDIARYIDGVVVKRRGRGGPPPGPFYLHGPSTDPADRRFWLQQLPGSAATVIQTKVERVGFSVLGQALVSTVLLPQRYAGARAHGIALGTAGDDDLQRVLPAVTDKVRIAAHPLDQPPARPTREYPPKPELTQLLLGGDYRLVETRIPLTRFEAAEALLVRGAPNVGAVEDLREREVIVVHTIGKATSLPVVGHAVFSATLIREQEPATLRSIILTARRDHVVEGVAQMFGVETFTGHETAAGHILQ